MHELDVFGQRLAQRLGHGLGTPIGDEPATDLGLDLFLELLDPFVVLVVLEALLERGQLATDLLAAGFHQLFEHRVEIEVAQRAIQVVRATDRPAGLHAGEALHGLSGQGAHQRLVAVHQGLHEQVGHLLGRQRVHRPACGTLALALAHLLLHLAPHLVEVVRRPSTRLYSGPRRLK